MWEVATLYRALQMYKTHFRVVLWSWEGPTFQNNKIKSASSSFSDISHKTEYSKCGLKYGYTALSLVFSTNVVCVKLSKNIVVHKYTVLNNKHHDKTKQ